MHRFGFTFADQRSAEQFRASCQRCGLVLVADRFGKIVYVYTRSSIALQTWLVASWPDVLLLPRTYKDVS